MAWIEVHQALRDHRKILALSGELDLPEAHVAGHVVYLWLWALDNAPDGMLPRSERIIEKAAGWAGTPGALVRALCAVGFLDAQPDEVLMLHDWYDYAGKLIDKRRANADRMRAARAASSNSTNAAQPPHEQDTSTPRATHVQRTLSARAGATVQYSTEPNHTHMHDVESEPLEPVAVSQPLPEVASATPAREKRKTSKDTTTAPTKDAKPRPRDPIWDALIAAFYEPKTQGERGRFGKVVHDLKAANATPEQIAERCAWHAHLLADGALRWTLTPTALANNWGEIERLWKSRDTPGGKPARQWVRAGALPTTPRQQAAIGPDELPNPFERKKPPAAQTA